MTDPRSEELEALRNLSIFGALKPETILFLRDQCEMVSVPKGGHFFQQGESGDSVYVLRTGRVAIVREFKGQGMILAELDPGNCFGEVALVGISPRTATVQALEECTALRLRYQSILTMFGNDLEQFTILQMNLAREVARRLVHADEALFEYARRCGETSPDVALLSRVAETLK